jgi:SNF2 family DNA or RNA helicase
VLSRKDLRPYQVRASKFIVSKKHAGLFLDMGLGKTISTLTGMLDLLNSGDVNRVLLVAPKRVCQGVWRQEARKWDHTRKITFKLIQGNERQRLMSMNSKAQIHLINPENLRWLLYVLKHYMKRKAFDFPYDTLIIDESGLFKSPSSKRFTTLRFMVKRFERRYILTGKPTPKGLEDLWSQIFILDEGERLGGEVGRFRARFFSPSGYMGYGHEADEGSEEKITRLIAPIVLTMRAEDYLDLPPVIVKNEYIDLPPRARAMYEKLQKEMFLALEEGDVVAENPAALTSKCHQLANGHLYIEQEEGSLAPKTWAVIHNEKIEALKEIAESTSENLLVPYYFKPDLARLRKAFPKAPAIADAKNERELTALQNAWNKGKHRMMFIHPQGGGHGLNLQFGGNRIVFFSLLWGHDPYDQVIQRIGAARQVGLRDHVMVSHILARDTVDELILLAQQRKYNNERHMIKLLKDYRDMMELLS